MDWDPEVLFHQNSTLVPGAQILDEKVNFAEGKEHIIDIPIKPKGCADVFIDEGREIGREAIPYTISPLLFQMGHSHGA